MTLHRALVYTLVGLVLVGALFVILSIWGVTFDPGLLFKLLSTVGVLIVIVGFLLVVRSDLGEHKNLKDQNFID